MPHDSLFEDDAVDPGAFRADQDNYSEKVDSLMNVIYHTILLDYSSDTLFISKFVLSQTRWQAYRDAELDAILPPLPEDQYGAYQKACRWQYKAALTKRRIEEMLVWYNGQTRGSICDAAESYMAPKYLKHHKSNAK